MNDKTRGAGMNGVRQWTYRAVGWGRYALLALTTFALPADASTFDDGNDPIPLVELQRKDPETLTEMERAILHTARRTGIIEFCDGGIRGNAFLIQFNGRAAVATSMSVSVSRLDAAPFCSGSKAKIIRYLPNISFNDPENPDQDEDFIWKKIDLEYPPAFEGEFEGSANYYTIALFAKDLAVYYIDENQSFDDSLQEEGSLIYVAYPTNSQRSSAYIFYTVDYDSNPRSFYQKCSFIPGSRFGSASHLCDTTSEMMGSLLAVSEGPGLGVGGIVSVSYQGEMHFDHVPERAHWNKAVPVETLNASQDPYYR